MLKFDKQSLEWAIKHLHSHGDTDIFPRPFELTFFHDCAPRVIEHLSGIDISHYSTPGILETLAPKGKFGFRLAHQPYPCHSLLLMAAIFHIAPQIESKRRPIAEGRALAYRISIDTDGNLFSRNHRYKDWLEYIYTKRILEEFKIVVQTDISDFYQRIYYHRLENVLTDITDNSPFARFILRMIKDYRVRQSFGLRVGSNFSRVIAEALMRDTDNALADEGYDTTRYVDDIFMFLQTSSNAIWRSCIFVRTLPQTRDFHYLL